MQDLSIPLAAAAAAVAVVPVVADSIDFRLVFDSQLTNFERNRLVAKLNAGSSGVEMIEQFARGLPTTTKFFRPPLPIKGRNIHLWNVG